jgi:hypothetical protein
VVVVDNEQVWPDVHKDIIWEVAARVQISEAFVALCRVRD